MHRALLSAARRAALSACAWAALVPCAAAQPATPSPVSQAPRLMIAASDAYLWAARASGGQTELVVRDRFRGFGPARSVRGSIACQAAHDAELYVFFEDGAFYRFAAERAGPSATLTVSSATAELSLPGRALPLTLAASARGLYALVESASAAELPVGGGTDDRPPRAQPGAESPWLVLYGSTGWRAVAPAPAGVTRTGAAALSPLDESVALYWRPPGGGVVRAVRLDAERAAWEPMPDVPLAEPDAFWPVVMDRIPCVASVERSDAPGPPRVHVLAGSAWSERPIALSPVPGASGPVRYRQAAAFNQQLCFVVDTDGAGRCIQFARPDPAPPSPTLTADEIFARGAPAAAFPAQVLVLAALLALFAALWTIRRGSLVTVVPLPPGWRLAGSLRRFGAFVIDIVPFTLLIAAQRQVDWPAAVGELLKWAIVGDLDAVLASQWEVLSWWLLSAGSFSAYALGMELTVGRTVGKLLTGLHLLNEAGRRPTPPQILLRNVMRAFELIPHLWAINLLALLTRNRQRLGDIFARTLVVRRAPLDPAATPGDAPPSPPRSDRGAGRQGSDPSERAG